MTATIPELLVDCSVVVAWKIISEPYASQARELFVDWQQGALRVLATDQLFVEMLSAFTKATRGTGPRLMADEARTAIQDVLDLPFSVLRTRGKRTVLRAFEIAQRYNQRGYDCVYVSVAERRQVEFWTGGQRLYNALHADYPLIRWIADYQPMRLTP